VAPSETECSAQHEPARGDERLLELIGARGHVRLHHRLRCVLVIQVQRVQEDAKTSAAAERKVLLHPGIDDGDGRKTIEIAASLQQDDGGRHAGESRPGANADSIRDERQRRKR